MNTEDATLQELIVRALTNSDRRARTTLESAAAGDPELMKFCAELEDVVSMLHGSNDWRAAAPSAELTAKVRQAVVSRLPAAPPHFRTVLLEADLGQRRATRKLIVGSVFALIAFALAIYLLQGSDRSTERLALKGTPVHEATFTAGRPYPALSFTREEKWEAANDGLHSTGSEDASAALYKESQPVDQALALTLDLKLPDLGDQTNAIVFLADAEGESNVPFDNVARPRSALALEITADGLVLNGFRRALLKSRPDAPRAGQFYRVRLEHLGRAARVLVNNEVVFDGPLPQPARGPLYAGVRVAGPRKNQIYINTLRVER